MPHPHHHAKDFADLIARLDKAQVAIDADHAAIAAAHAALAADRAERHAAAAALASVLPPGGGTFRTNVDGTVMAFLPDGAGGVCMVLLLPASTPIPDALPPQPSDFTISFTRVDAMYSGTIQLPEIPTDPAVLNGATIASQLLVITVNGTSQPDLTPALDAGTVDTGPIFNVGDTGTLSLRYLNPSQLPGPETVEPFTVSDQHVPPAPGEFGISFSDVPATGGP